MIKIIFKILFIDIFSLTKYSFEPLFKTSNDHRLLECISRLSGSKESVKAAFRYIYYKLIFERKLSRISITPSDYIKNKFWEFNHSLYPVLIHLIENHNRIKGLDDKLREFFTLSGNDLEFESHFNEIVGVHFLETQLNYKVLSVEIKSQPIISPYSKNNKSCDILASDGNQNIYFESKKSLSQDLRPRTISGDFEHFTPISHNEIHQWIRNKLYEANQKGADYLLIRVPFWSPIELIDDQEKIELWMSRTFKGNEKISGKYFRIKLDGFSLTVTKGFYIIFPNNFIKVEVLNNKK